MSDAVIVAAAARGREGSRAAGTRWRPFAALARRELVQAVRGRLVVVFAVVFAALALAVAWAGTGSAGEAAFGLTRTTTGLLELVLVLFPLVGLIVGANGFVEVRGQELLLAQPIDRHTVLLARYAGLALALAAAALVGFGLAGVYLGARTGDGDAAGYLVFALAGVGLLLAALAVGCLAGILGRTRARALAGAVVTWFAWTVLYDLVAIALVGSAAGAQLRWSLIALLAGSPVDAARVLVLFAIGADTLLGATGAALAHTMRETQGLLVLTVALAAWTFLPLALALARFRREDL